jgi:hypothetical protein
MDLPCVVCGDAVSVLSDQEPRCGLCFDMPKPTRCAADPRFTDAEWGAWHAGADVAGWESFWTTILDGPPSFAPLPGMEQDHRIRTEYFRWRSLHDRNRVRSTGDWQSYQRAMRDYAELEG